MKRALICGVFGQDGAYLPLENSYLGRRTQYMVADVVRVMTEAVDKLHLNAEDSKRRAQRA